jgi:hypothetical protein
MRPACAGRQERASLHTSIYSPYPRGQGNGPMAKLNGEVRVSAEQGAVLVSDGSHTDLMQEGRTSSPEPAAPEGVQGKNKKRGGAPVPAASQTIGGASKTLLVDSAVAAAAVGAVLAVITTGPPASPADRNQPRSFVQRKPPIGAFLLGHTSVQRIA